MSFSNIIVYEFDTKDNFYPFSILHPVWEIRIGALRIFEKWEKLSSIECNFMHYNNLVVESFRKRFNRTQNHTTGKTLLIDSTIIPDKNLFDDIEKIKYDTKLILEGEIVGYIITSEYEINSINEVSDIEKKFDLNSFNLNEVTKLNYIFDVIESNGKFINKDLDLLSMKRNNSLKGNDVKVLRSENLYIGENVRVDPFTFIDCSNGPVIIDDEVHIMSNSTLIGPLYIGKNTLIKTGAKIYENTSIGEVCKVGGEVENSIFQSYSNKQHDGFLGHSFISEWVNLGANTNNSDLKNTYSNISLTLRDDSINTNSMFMGLFCGDHTKTAINTKFNTGTVSGVCGIIVNDSFPPTHIPSFSWGGRHKSPKYKFLKAIEVAEIVMNRRDKTLCNAERELLEAEYNRLP